jgi:limonene-1,2-epoxide hydrolase
MSEKARENVMAYVSNHDVSQLAENVVFKMMATGQESHGREEVGQMLNYFYNVVFKAEAEIHTLIFAENNAVLEADIVGRQLLEIAGIPPREGEVRIPLCVVYDLANDRIVQGRIYLETEALRRA